MATDREFQNNNKYKSAPSLLSAAGVFLSMPRRTPRPSPAGGGPNVRRAWHRARCACPCHHTLPSRRAHAHAFSPLLQVAPAPNSAPAVAVAQEHPPRRFYTWVERSAATVPGIEGSLFLSEFPRVACVQYDRLLGQARYVSSPSL